MTVKSFTVIVSVLLIVALLGGCGAQAPSESVTTTTVAKVNGTTSDVPLAGEPTVDCVRTTSAGEIPSTVSPARPTKTKATSTSSSTVSTSLSTTTTAAPTVHTLTPLASSSYYGLCELRKLPNGEVLAEVYQKIVDAVENCQATVEIGETLTESEMMTAFYHYYADYPQHFWCDGKMRYTVSQRTDKVVQLKLSYTMTGEALQRARADFHKAVLSLLKIAATGNDEYERELLLHDALAKRVTYQEGENAHNAYGALVKGEAVCEGYARAFQYLLYQSGIQCLMAEGTSISPFTGLSEGHAWNVARIDGQYYHVDPTWDDTDDANTPVVYPYFNLTTAQINENHTISSENSYALPKCVATANNFHVKNGTRLTEYTVDGVARMLTKTTGDTHIYCVGGAQSFVDWFNKNHNAVLKAMGIERSYSFSMLYTGNEVVVRLTIS
ncbi:MAG: hypothetical protein IJO75_00075 [Clostridia bacterium]|nr:hypothetical protein [Clostridia bacterium]